MGTITDAMSGDAAAKRELAMQALRLVSRKFSRKPKNGSTPKPSILTRITKSPWYTTIMFIRTEVTELVIQFLAFANPTQNENIWEPLVLGASITASAIVTPVLFILGRDNLLTAFNGTFSVLFAVLAIVGPGGLFSIFLESPGPTGLVSTFNAIEAWPLIVKCLSAVAPLISFAGILYGRWTGEIKRQAKKTSRIAAGSSEEDEAEPRPIKILRWVFLVFSWAVGVVCLAALAGWGCATFHTCQVPPCSIAEADLPWGLTDAHLPFNYPSTGPGTTSGNWGIQQRLQATSGTLAGEWNWNQRSNLGIGYKVNKTNSGTYMLTLTTTSNGGASNRAITGPSGSMNVQSLQGHNQGSLTCVASFHLQCQEASTRQSLRNNLGATEFVQFRTDGTLKLVLADPKPDCWMADASDADSAWWYEHVIFGPGILAGVAADGTAIQGLVYKNDTCSESTLSQTPQGQDPPSCFMPSEAMFFPGLGRSPIPWASEWATGPLANSLPTSWTSHISDFVAEMSISAQEIQNALTMSSGDSSGGGGNAPGPVAPGPAGPGPAGPVAPGPTGTHSCMGGPNCGAVCGQGMCTTSDQTACTSATGADSNPCTFQASSGGGGAPSGPHCAGPAGCELNSDSGSCQADSRGCNWNT